MAEVTLTGANFDEEVMSSDIPVLVDFWASWCGPCKMLAPILEEIASEFEGKAKIGKVNVDDEIELAERFGVQSIPTLILFKGGEIVSQTAGVRPKEAIKALLEG